MENQEPFLRAVLDAIPSPVMIVDDDVRIIDCNVAGSRFAGVASELILQRRSGEVLHCIHSTETQGGCGHAPACRDCTIRNSVQEAWNGGQVCRRAQRMQLVSGEEIRELNLLVTTAPFHYGGSRLVLLFLEDISELTSLRRIVPMCASCRKVRNGQEYWQKVELYFRQYLNIDVTHGICPECAERLYPEFSSKQLG